MNCITQTFDSEEAAEKWLRRRDLDGSARPQTAHWTADRWCIENYDGEMLCTDGRFRDGVQVPRRKAYA